MENFDAVIYGIIQGLTEFLPVSSSAHLALLPRFLSIKDPGAYFDLAMHLGTALSLIVYFFKDIRDEIKSMLSKDFSFFLNIFISLLGTFVLVLILKKMALTHGRSAGLIAINLMVFGILMFVFDRKDSGSFEPRKVFSWKRSLLIGLMQAIAIFPGVSRSGITLTACRAAGFRRKDALRYSFLLSLPVILGGGILESKEILKSGAQFDGMILFWGILSSFVVGILGVHFLMKVVEKIGLLPFTIYRLIVGVLLLTIV